MCRLIVNVFIYVQGTVLSIGRQLTSHRRTIDTISGRLGGGAATRAYLNKCLYYVNIGSNDYLNNYFLPLLYPSSRLFNLNQFADRLIINYSRQIRVHIINIANFLCVIFLKNTSIYFKNDDVKEIFINVYIMLLYILNMIISILFYRVHLNVKPMLISF